MRRGGSHATLRGEAAATALRGQARSAHLPLVILAACASQLLTGKPGVTTVGTSWRRPGAGLPGARHGRRGHRVRRRQVGDYSARLRGELPDASALQWELEESQSWKAHLDPRQRSAVEAACRGENVFITGGAGTGKTSALQAVVRALKEKYGEDFQQKVAVTAATGTAAVLAGGCTLNSAAGVKVPHYVNDFKKVHKTPYRAIWRALEVLLIDEASMISGEFFDLFEARVRILRQNQSAFGGMQVILVGDLFQLKPIEGKLQKEQIKELDPDMLKQGRAVIRYKSGYRKECFFNRGMIFQSDVFWELGFKYVELNIPHRQKNDQRLVKILDSIRMPSTAMYKAIFELNEHCWGMLCKPPDLSGGEDKVFLVPFHRQVNKINSERLENLPGTSKVFEAFDNVMVSAEEPENATTEELELWHEGINKILWKSQFLGASGCPVIKSLTLKVGAFVTLTQTLDVFRGLVNGVTGHVVKMPCRGSGAVLVKFDGNSRPVPIERHKFESHIPGLGSCFRTQYPLRLAWAITHHRCQGKTMDRVVVDPRSFTHGQTYVALSRSRRLEGLQLLSPVMPNDIRANPYSLHFTRLHRAGQSPEDIRRAVGHWRSLQVDGLPRAAHAAGPPELVAFGKHAGRTFADVAEQDPGYIRWILGRNADTLSAAGRRFHDFCSGLAAGAPAEPSALPA